MTMRLPFVLLFCLFCLPLLRAGDLVHDHDRIVFIGDSITGQGAKGGPNGWIGLIGEGISLVRPGAAPTLTGLGGSGMTVGAWVGTEKKSRDAGVYLDVKTTDVKATLDGGAEVVVIMLGMNDLLSPGVKDTPADFDAWLGRYRDLVEAVKARAHPRLFAFATITLCTEDPASPKNRVGDELNSRLAALAKEENGVVLPTREAMKELLASARSARPEAHVTADYVHPNSAGHLAIAVGMLRGLGEPEAAAKLLEKHAEWVIPAAAAPPTLSYVLTPHPGSPDDPKSRFTLAYTVRGTWDKPPVVRPVLPEGWEAVPENGQAPTGSFEITGPLDRIENKAGLTTDLGSQTLRADVVIPPGWRIAVGGGTGLGWAAGSISYDASLDHVPADDVLAKDEGYAAPLAFPDNTTSDWKDYVPSLDFTGGNKPGSVDLAAVAFFKIHDISYGARWVRSDKDRPVTITLGTQSFAGNHSLALRLNDDSLYAGRILNEPGRKIVAEGKLRKGWNRLAFRATFIQWQWQFSVDLAGKEGDDLADLRYATSPQKQ